MHDIGHDSILGKPVMEPGPRGVITERHYVAGEIAVTVVEWSCIDVYVTKYDNLPTFTDESMTCDSSF